MRPRRRKLLAEGISQKTSPPLVSKPQILALARRLCWMCKKKLGVADEKKGRKQWAAIQIKCRFCICDFYVTNEKKKGKDEKWREINIIGLAGPLVSFGELRLSTITAQSLPRNPELGKSKPGLSFLFFFLSSSLSHSFSHPLHLICLPALFLFLIVSFPCRLSTVCSPKGIFKAVVIQLQAPKRPQHAA